MKRVVLVLLFCIFLSFTQGEMACLESIEADDTDNCPASPRTNSGVQCSYPTLSPSVYGDGCIATENAMLDSVNDYTTCLCLRAYCKAQRPPGTIDPDCCCSLCEAVCDISHAACKLVDCLTSCPEAPPCAPVKMCGNGGQWAACCDVTYQACIANCENQPFDTSKFAGACTSALGKCLNGCGSSCAGSSDYSSCIQSCSKACISSGGTPPSSSGTPPSSSGTPPSSSGTPPSSSGTPPSSSGIPPSSSGTPPSSSGTPPSSSGTPPSSSDTSSSSGTPSPSSGTSTSSGTPSPSSGTPSPSSGISSPPPVGTGPGQVLLDAQTQNTDTYTEASNTLSVGAIVGIVVGSIAGLSLLVVAAVFIIKFVKKSQTGDNYAKFDVK